MAGLKMKLAVTDGMVTGADNPITKREYIVARISKSEDGFTTFSLSNDIDVMIQVVVNNELKNLLREFI